MDAKIVLVVDDEMDSREIWSTILRRHGYHVLQAADGEQALAVTREQHPDLVLMDLMLPRLNGWSAAECLKLDSSTADIPLVALTVRFSEADQERARACGFEAYLIKPCEPRRVLQEVQRFIGPVNYDADP